MIILDKNTAKAEIDNTDYFDRMSSVEINYRVKSIHSYYPMLSNIWNIRDLYKSLILDFTQEEKNAIYYYHNIVDFQFKNKLPALYPDGRYIKYMKLSQNVDWNYPYTINRVVVIPQKLAKNMVDNLIIDRKQNTVPSLFVWNLVRPNFSAVNYIANIICHEWIHIAQRYAYYTSLGSKLDEIYQQSWGFVRELPPAGLYKKYDINPLYITNPDAENGEWSIYIKAKKYYPILTLDRKTKMPDGMLLDKSNMHTYDYTKEYINKFYGLQHQLYHPAEIFAHLVANYIINNKTGITTWNATNFFYRLNSFI